MIENWSADCFHVNVTFVNATTVSILCQQNTTQYNQTSNTNCNRGLFYSFNISECTFA